MSAATRELARLEGRRMLRHPAPWAGLALTLLMGFDVWGEDWSGQRYTGLVAALTPLLLGVSVASVSAFGRELVPVAEAAPLGPSERARARLAGGLPLVTLVALVVAAGAVGLRLVGGVPLGDDPGRTLHAHHTLPELLQPVLLAAVAVVVGAVAVRVLRHTLAAAIVLTVLWFLVGGTYWLFAGPGTRWVAVVQVQPFYVEVGPIRTDPSTFPADWLLSAPGEYQDHWARLVVSPLVALAHDAYLLGLVLLLLGVVLAGAARRALLTLGLALAIGAVALQHAAAPYDDGERVEPAAAVQPVEVRDDATPVVVDTDLGGDDLAALAFLMRRPDVRVVAVTIAGTGLVGCDPGVDLVADLVDGLGARRVPVACGREDAARAMPQEWRDAAAAGTGLARVPTTSSAVAEPAPELIGRLAARHPGLRVVALGPLTNLADLATDDRSAYAEIAGVTTMAGALDAPAVDGVAEWNAAADPAALTRVLAGPVPVTVVPDDAVPDGTPGALLRSPVSAVVTSAALPKWWDLATAATALDRGAATVEGGTWTVDATGRLTRSGPGDVLVATELDQGRLDAAYERAFG